MKQKGLARRLPGATFLILGRDAARVRVDLGALVGLNLVLAALAVELALEEGHVVRVELAVTARALEALLVETTATWQENFQKFCKISIRIFYTNNRKPGLPFGPF